ncbi:undecaprenyldiphospho-muramoylpentapeptide beta-N-acetylglucosaminyltransferase [Oerskovia jenensis]|uniref:undecaprenyldiphospho-muramoylpentapeptide beta-N-acetylglucosaminyltransferase n=1 Tax=Oerskovia jenensis TaxID=162169 RepID=UPI00196296A1|nr:undecaprenyldiphospho-muramoylpentapeptide beta-N-acetylglucosaminyltransferase [Oerskovia jenensis]
MVSSSVGSVVLAGGGTAGHVNPLLAVADELRARNPETVVTVLGTQSGLEADLVPARGYPLRFVPKVPLPRRPSGEWVALPGKLKAAVDAAGAVIDETRAEVVVGFGGYVSTPAYIAAHRRGVPIVIHEQNARPGLANRAGARWATSVALTFEGTPLKGGVVTGLPLRWEIADLIRDRGVDAPTVRANAAASLGLDPARPTVVVTGGSLGAQSLNEAVSGAARELLATGAQVLHLTGRGKAEAVRTVVDGLPGYDVREYLSEMHLAYAVADLVVCRSGAGTVSELAALGIPAVYVPLPIGNGEQRLNAGPVVRAGGGILVEDEAFTAAWVAANVPPLVADGDRLRTMASLASRAGIQDATARVADLVARAAGGAR